MIVRADPVANDAAGMLKSIKPAPVHVLLFRLANHTLVPPNLLWPVRHSDFLPHAIAAHQHGGATADVDQSVFGLQQ